MAKKRPAIIVMLPALLLALLVILAWLQYRWTGEISVAEQDRLEASLQSSVRRFSAELDDEAGSSLSSLPNRAGGRARARASTALGGLSG